MKSLHHSPFIRSVTIAGMLLGLLFAAGPVHAQSIDDLPTRPYLPLSMALAAANAALTQCEADGYQVSVAVVDRSGELKVLLKGDGAGPHTINSSSRKAFTAASLGLSTQELAQTVAGNPEFFGLHNMDERILILAGGLPIVAADAVVGGIGVGGAPGGHLDEACAQAGIDAIAGTESEAAGPAASWCQFAGTGATITISDQPANFICDSTGEQQTVLVGNVRSGAEGWMVERAVVTRSESSFTALSQEDVIVTQIELEDGVRCAFAGTGATLAFDQKRVNFTCDAGEEQQTVLLGEIVEEEQGWMIEKALLARTADGFAIEESEIVPISALNVGR